MVLLIDRGHDVGDVLLDARRRDAVRLVEGLLLLAPAAGLGHGALHRARHMVGIEDDLASTRCAALPMVWTSEVADLRKPSLSASRMATRAHSGMLRPSRSRLMPIKMSKAPSRKSRMISMRSSVSMSECM